MAMPGPPFVPMGSTPVRSHPNASLLDGRVRPTAGDPQRDVEVLASSRSGFEFNEDRDHPFLGEEFEDDLAVARIDAPSIDFWRCQVSDLRVVCHPDPPASETLA